MRREALDLDCLLRIIDDAAALGVPLIGFTGGDPFVRLDDLRQCIARAALRKISSVVVTSAFWATSEGQAVRVLRSLGPLYMLGVSTDLFHQAFTPIQHVRNAIRAAKQVGIARIEVQAAVSDSGQIRVTQDDLGEDAAGVALRFQPLWRVATLRSENSDLLKPLADLVLDCPTTGPTVTATGQLVGCCSSLLHLAERNPLTLGDVRRDGFAASWGSGRLVPYYRLVTTLGLLPHVESLRLSGDPAAAALLNDRYTSVCDFCYAVHASPRARDIVNSALAPQNPPAPAATD